MDGLLSKGIEGKVLILSDNSTYSLDGNSNSFVTLIIETKEGLESIDFKIKKVDDITILCLNKLFKGNNVLYTVNSYESNSRNNKRKIFEYHLKITTGPFYGVEYFYYS